MNHKDLNLLLNAMLRQAKQCRRNMDHVFPFAAMLTSQGKIAQLAAPARPGHFSVQDTIRTLEGGLYTRARQGMCKAVGICFDLRSGFESDPGEKEAVHAFLEHHDGSAYLVVVPYANSGTVELASGNVITTSAVPKFFVNAIIRSA